MKPIGMVVVRDESLPRNVWYAKVDRRTGACEVEVGRFVEIDPAPTPKWVVAGCWDGDFAEGGFHASEHVFGSGLRLDGDDVVVVPAHSTVDRCVYARDGHVWHVSNSMVVLLGRLGARLDPRKDHRMWSESMCFGVYNYVRQLAVIHPRMHVISQLIWEKLRIGPDGQASFRFTDPPREFRDYAHYVAEFEAAMAALWKNATDARRQRPMRAVASASRGYDSSTVLAFATKVVGPGLLSWSAPRSNTRMPAAVQKLLKTNLSDDDGSDIARTLGATPRYLDMDYSRIDRDLEAWIWSSGQINPEIVFHSLLEEAAQHDVPTLFFAGHAGDGVWERGLGPLYQEGQVVRGAQSGYALIEARNAYGVVEYSAPYMFIRSVGSVYKVTNSPEMKPWTLGNNYDRPICRRVLEERGVPREAFGFGKKAVAQDFESPQGKALRELFFSMSDWSPVTESIYRGLNFGLYFAGRGGHYLRTRGDRGKMLSVGAGDAKRKLASVRDLQRGTLLWTSGWLADRYARR